MALPARRPGDAYDQETVLREERQNVVTPSGNVVGQDVVATEQVDRAAARASSADWLTSLVYFLTGLVGFLLALRIVLKLLAANPDSGFTRFIYGLSGPLVAPFAGIVGTPGADNGAVFEVSTLIALVVYLIVGWGIARLLALLVNRPASGVSATRSVGQDTRTY
ncbi:MAG: YggT family protein [Thermomicrobiales bacterium]